MVEDLQRPRAVNHRRLVQYPGDHVEEVVKSIKEILIKDAPYSDIPKLPDLSERFIDAYINVIKKIEGPIFESIADSKTRVFEELGKKSYEDEIKEKYIKMFMEIKDKATTCNNVATLISIKTEADALKNRLLNEMYRKDSEIADEIVNYNVEVTETKPKVKKRRSISIKNVNLTSSWQIESVVDIDEYIGDLRKQIMKELNEEQKAQVQKLLDKIEDDEDVQNVFHNMSVE